MNRISSGYNEYNRYQQNNVDAEKSLLAVAKANQQAAVKVDDLLGSAYDEQVSVSDETQKKLANLNLAKLLAKQVPQSVDTEQSQKVAQFKALFAKEGGIADYLASLNSEEVAQSMLTHPLAPSLV